MGIMKTCCPADLPHLRRCDRPWTVPRLRTSNGFAVQVGQEYVHLNTRQSAARIAGRLRNRWPYVRGRISLPAPDLSGERAGFVLCQYHDGSGGCSNTDGEHARHRPQYGEGGHSHFRVSLDAQRRLAHFF